MSKMPDGRPVEYVGDGVYAIYDSFGGIWLHANHHLNPTDRVYLEGFVWDNLLKFKKHCEEMRDAEQTTRST